jgi:hypothetical protein
MFDILRNGEISLNSPLFITLFYQKFLEIGSGDFFYRLIGSPNVSCGRITLWCLLLGTPQSIKPDIASLWLLPERCSFVLP